MEQRVYTRLKILQEAKDVKKQLLALFWDTGLNVLMYRMAKLIGTSISGKRFLSSKIWIKVCLAFDIDLYDTPWQLVQRHQDTLSCWLTTGVDHAIREFHLVLFYKLPRTFQGLFRFDTKVRASRLLKRLCKRLKSCEYFLSFDPPNGPCPFDCQNSGKLFFIINN